MYSEIADRIGNEYPAAFARTRPLLAAIRRATPLISAELAQARKRKWFGPHYRPIVPPPRDKGRRQPGDTSPTYLLFQTLLPLFWTLPCMIRMKLTRTDAVFSRTAMMLFYV